MTKISEAEFANICEGIRMDRKAIIANNPIGSENVVLLWMLLGVLVSYLNLSDVETPCFNGQPDEQSYRDAINFVLANRKKTDFETERYLDVVLK